MNQKTKASGNTRPYKSHLDRMYELEQLINDIEAPMWDDVEWDNEMSRVLWFTQQERKLAPLMERLKKMKEIQSAIDAD